VGVLSAADIIYHMASCRWSPGDRPVTRTL